MHTKVTFCFRFFTCWKLDEINLALNTGAIEMNWKRLNELSTLCTIVFLIVAQLLWTAQVLAIDRTPPIDLFTGIRGRFKLVLHFCQKRYPLRSHKSQVIYDVSFCRLIDLLRLRNWWRATKFILRLLGELSLPYATWSKILLAI